MVDVFVVAMLAGGGLKYSPMKSNYPLSLFHVKFRESHFLCPKLLFGK